MRRNGTESGWYLTTGENDLNDQHAKLRGMESVESVVGCLEVSAVFIAGAMDQLESRPIYWD